MATPSASVRARLAGVAAAVAALLGTAVAAGPAAALPGDPPVTLLAPAPGATLPIGGDPVPVAFACPSYREEESPLFGTLRGTAADYVPRLATSPAVGADGRLTDTVATGLAVERAAEPGTCDAGLGNTGFPRPQSTPGTYWWQVERTCGGCTGGVEVSAVGSFTLRAVAVPTLTVPARAWAGYPFTATIGYPNPAGGAQTTRTVERRVGTAWRTVATETTDGSPLVALPRGTHTLRAVVTVGGQATPSAPRTVRVLRPVAWTTARADGTYRDRQRPSVRLRVTGDGRRITGFTAEIPLVCVTPSGSVTPNTATLVLPPVRIAPDGRFAVAARTAGIARRLTGRIVGTRFVATTARFANASCAGSITVGARRTGS